MLQHERPPTLSLAQARDDFLAALLTIAGDTRLLWLPQGNETTTSTDKSLNGRTITYDATIAARLSRLGLGYGVSFDGSAHHAFTPDAAGLSFGNGTADSAFSIIALANITNTANGRALMAKFSVSATLREWLFNIDVSDKLSLSVYDESVDQQPIRTSDVAITQGAVGLFGGTYSAATGGATAANDMTLYENGVLKASTATNAGTYVAMEDLNQAVGVFSRGTSGGPEIRFQGTAYMGLVCQKALSASEHWAIKQLVNGYFGLSL